MEVVTDFAASRMRSKLETAFKLRLDPFEKTRDIIERDLKRKLAQ